MFGVAVSPMDACQKDTCHTRRALASWQGSGKRDWNLREAAAILRPMKKLCLALIAAATIAAPAFAAPGGMLGTLAHGDYVCSLPGDASGAARELVEIENFVIATASTYSTEAGWGTYLLTGTRVTFSRGPRKGAAYIRESNNTLRKLGSQGEETDLRCTRRGTHA